MDIASLLGDDASLLLDHQATAFSKDLLTVPGPTFLDDVFAFSDRNANVLRNLGLLYNHGRLGGTGYLSILPVDQGIEHSAAASFAPYPSTSTPLDCVISPLRVSATPSRRPLEISALSVASTSTRCRSS